MNIPIDSHIIQNSLQRNGITSISKASIRQMAKVVQEIEHETNVPFVKMEMGVPGIAPSSIGINAEIAALQSGVASQYPNIEGIPALKQELALFCKNFLNISVAPESCLPTVGSMQGGYAAFLTISKCFDATKKILSIDPGFPVQKQQMALLGIEHESFDVYNYRGKQLEEKLESYCAQNSISAILYSSPNNPSWICFTPEELQIIAKVARKYDCIVIEDLAYFGMDFREDYGTPAAPPYQPSIAQYYNNYILLLSASKVFSYAGQRIAALILSDDLRSRTYPQLARTYPSEEFGKALIFGSLYSLSSGTAHSAQYAFAALLQAANNGTFNFRTDLLEYEQRAKNMKELFVNNGFSIVYDTDIDRPIADGFYFTISYKQLSADELLYELLHYGISAIALSITGSQSTQGLRACASQINVKEIELLRQRLLIFNTNH